MEKNYGGISRAKIEKSGVCPHFCPPPVVSQPLKSLLSPTVLGMYTGRVYDTKAYFKLSTKTRAYGAKLSPDGSYYIVGKKGHDLLCHLNEPNKGERANCYFLSFAVGMAEQGAAHEDLHMLWVVTADMWPDKIVEYTICYGKDYSAVRLDPQGEPYIAGKPPIGMGPTPTQSLALVMAFCKSI